MAVARVNSIITVTGAEASLSNFDNNAGSLAQGATKIDVGSDPVRRVIILKTTKLVIEGTTADKSVESSLAWDPVQETLYVSNDSPDGTGDITDSNAHAGAGGAIEVRKGGFLNIGTSTAGTDGTSYSAGDAVVIAKKGSGNSDIATGSICAEAGSRVHLKGCSISLAGSSRFDGANTISSRPADERATTGCELRINDVVIRVQRGTSYLAPRIYTDDYQIDGLHQIGGTIQIQNRKLGSQNPLDDSYIRNITLDQMEGGLSIAGNNFGTDTTIYLIDGVTGGLNSDDEITVFNKRGVEIRNSANGSLIKASLLRLTHGSRNAGFFELTKDVTIVVRDAAGNPVQGARVHYEDTVAGRGHVAWPADGVQVVGTFLPQGTPQPTQYASYVYTDKQSGSELTDVNGEAHFVVKVADMVFPNSGAGGTQPAQTWKLRGISNVAGEDQFLFHVDSYKHLGADSPVDCLGVGTRRFGFAVVDDPAVTEQNIATVASWNGFTTNHALDYITISGQTYTLDQLYDWLKRDKTLDPSVEHPTRAGMVASADGTVLDLGGYGLGLDSTAVLNPGVKFRSVRTTGTIDVATGGQINVGYQDSTGKSILLRLGAPQTSLVYDTGGPPTHVAGGLHELHRISLPPAATLNLTVIRELFYYRKYTMAVADITEIAVTLFRNPNIDAGTVINGVDITTYPQTLDGAYANNIGFDKSSNALIPSNIRLGNFNTSGRKALTRKLLDRLMNTQAALEAIHAHNDADTRAFDIRQDELMIDQRWLGIDRQAVSEPPNAAGSLQNLARFGLYVVHWDDITPYEPRNVGAYFVAIDPYTPSTGLSQQALLNVGRALATEDAVVDGIADAVDVKLTPDLRKIDDDVGGVSRQIDALPIDELLNEAVSVYNVPLATATPNIFTGAPGSSYSLVGGNLQIDFAQTVPDNVSDISLSLEGLVAFALPIPVDNDLVLQVTVRAQALTGGARHIDPDFVWEWTLGAGASTDLRRRMGFLKESHVGQVLATVGGLGPASIIEFEVGRPASSIDITGADLGMDPPVRNANEHLRIVVTRVEWVRKHTATLDDFKADLTELDGDVTAIKAKTDGLNFTGDDVKATLDGEAPNLDISTLATQAKLTEVDEKLDDMNPVLNILPYYVNRFGYNGGGSDDTHILNEIIFGGAGIQTFTRAVGGSRIILIYAVDGIDDFVHGIVKLTRSGFKTDTGVAIPEGTPCGEGKFQIWVANDVNNFTEAEWVAFEGNVANNPVHEENFGSPGDPVSLFGERDIETPSQLNGFNRIIIVFYRSDPTPFLNGNTRIDLSGLKVDARLQLYDGAIIKDNVSQTRKMLTNRTKIDPVANTTTTYEDDGTTPFVVKDLKDPMGNADTEDAVEEVPR